jgi:SAM-dependent methyltransferase
MSTEPAAVVDTYGQKIPPEAKPGYFRLHRDRYVALLEALEIPVGGHVLEIGCQPGQFTEILVQAGYYLSGLDLHPEHRWDLWERLGVEMRGANLETDPIPYDDAVFDAVVFSEVIEHLPGSPLPALEEIHRVLVPGGQLVLSTPNAHYLRERVLLGLRLLLWQSLESSAEFRHRMRMRGEDRYNVHHHLFTGGELRWLLGEAGFSSIQIRPVAAREGVGVSWKRLLRWPWRVLPKAALWGITSLVPPLRSMLLLTARAG